MFSPIIDQLINALRLLPGIGPKSAQRMALNILERNRDNGLHIAESLTQAINNIKHCQACNTLCETELCDICNSPRRDNTQLCIVETPADIIAIENTNSYKGMYFVLMGHLSPLDGIGPKEISIDRLQKRLNENIVQEIILATNPTIEGEATAHYIANLVKQHGIKCSRIAYGVPMGGELEYLDSHTLTRAFSGRIVVDETI